VNVTIVAFPMTRVAAIEHLGPPALEHATARKLIEWRIANRLAPDRHRSYGVHYTDPRTTSPADHRVDFCVSFEGEVPMNADGIVAKIIPANRCAVATHRGSRSNNSAAFFLWEEWLPGSGERPGSFPIFFHYVNVGPAVHDDEMVTDVYLPLECATPEGR
jgi:AraC family transcriptional regulator